MCNNKKLPDYPQAFANLDFTNSMKLCVYRNSSIFQVEKKHKKEGNQLFHNIKIYADFSFFKITVNLVAYRIKHFMDLGKLVGNQERLEINVYVTHWLIHTIQYLILRPKYFHLGLNILI